MLTLARFSEAFLVLRAQSVGIPLAFLPLVLATMSASYALSAHPAGALSDRLGRRHLLGFGFASLIAADLVLAHAARPASVLAGALWETFGPAATFHAGAAITVVGLAAFLFLPHPLRRLPGSDG